MKAGRTGPGTHQPDPACGKSPGRLPGRDGQSRGHVVAFPGLCAFRWRVAHGPLYPRPMVREKPQQTLRRGWTTGACATAATKAALTALVTGRFPIRSKLHCPRVSGVAALAREELGDGWARAESSRCGR